MSEKYKFHNPDGVYLITLAVVGWIDVFSRSLYRDIIVDSLNFCVSNKGLSVYAWVVMSNHVHLVARSESGELSGILRDFKRHTAHCILAAINGNCQESRRDWLLELFERAGAKMSCNSKYQF